MGQILDHPYSSLLYLGQIMEQSYNSLLAHDSGTTADSCSALETRKLFIDTNVAG